MRHTEGNAVYLWHGTSMTDPKKIYESTLEAFDITYCRVISNFV